MPAHSRAILALSLLVLVPCSLPAEEPPQLTIGRLADGRIAVPTNQVLAPAGQQVEFSGRPVDLALIDGGRTLVVKNLNNLVLIDTASGEVKQTLASPAGFSVVGLVAEDRSLLATDVKDHLRRAVRGDDGRFTWEEPIRLNAPQVQGASYPAGIARLDTGRVWVASSRGNCVQLVNLDEGKVEQEVAVGVAPYTVCVARPDRGYATNWGGDRPAEGDRQAGSSGTPAHVDERGIANRGTVSVLGRHDGAWRQEKTIAVGLHPSGMALDRSGRFLYVANANSDTVSVIRTDCDAVVETIACRPDGRLPFGSGCNALALSPGGETLYVANGTNNALSVVRLGAGRAAPAARGPSGAKSRD